MASAFDEQYESAFETLLETHGRDVEYVTPTGSRIPALKAIRRELTPDDFSDIPGFTGELGRLGAFWEIRKTDIDPDGVCDKEDQIFDVADEECWLIQRVHDETHVSWRIYATPI